MRGQRNTVRFFPHHGVAVFFFVTAMAFMLSGCGLPTSDYLYPPAKFESSGSTLIRLYHQTENIDYSDVAALFKGYEIYYRIFDNSTDAIASYNDLVTLAYNDSFTSTNISTVASSKGYCVLINGDKNTAALISVSDNTYTYFELNLNSSSTWTLTGTEDNNTTTDIFSNIVRNKTDSTTADFYDSSKYSSTDYDYSGNSLSTDDSVYIVFFAVACGTSSSLTDIYSDPVIIEPVEYTVGG